MARWIGIAYRAVAAIHKHIASKESLTSGGESVRIQEPFDDGVVVTGLEVIPASVIGIILLFFERNNKK